MAAYGKRNHQYFQCDHCGMETSNFNLHEGNCSAEEVQGTSASAQDCGKELCTGCLHDCAECDRSFCPDHIVAIPVAGMLHTAEHMCLGCHGKRQQLKEAA